MNLIRNKILLIKLISFLPLFSLANDMAIYIYWTRDESGSKWLNDFKYKLDTILSFY